MLRLTKEVRVHDHGLIVGVIVKLDEAEREGR
jgi:hypothetical protein